MTYEKETIDNIKLLLNGMEVKGIENCKRIVLIAQLLETTVKETDNGTK